MTGLPAPLNDVAQGAIYGQMYQGGDAVSKTVCGGFDSQLSVPEAG